MSSVPRAIRRVTRTGRAPLTSLGIPFGLSGLAGTWTMAARAGLATNVVAEVLWVVAALAWVLVVANYLGRSRNRGGSIAADLRDPVQGAFATLAPTVGMLVCTHYAAYLPRSGRIATSVFMVIALVFGAWFLAQLVQHERSLDAVHAGYLLPTVAAAFIVAQGAGTFAWDALAVASIAVGLLTWVLIGTIVLARMAFRPAPPAALLPVFAIFSAPPAVAGNAWFAHNGGQPDSLETLLLGTFVVLILVQVMMLGTYARLPFHLGFWAFTFTAASSGTYAVHWLALWGGAGYKLWAWLAVLVVTVLIGAIAVRSVGVLLRAHAASRVPADPAGALEGDPRRRS